VTYYPDLSPCTYFDHDFTREWWASHLIAVGWLEPDQTKPHCDVPPPDEILDKLFSLVSDSWPPIGCLGYHACGFCPNAQPATATEVSYKGRTYVVGASNILVPGPGKVFVAPSLVVHYVLDHSYRLPHEFCSALLSCPPPGSRAYVRAIKRNGPRAFDGTSPGSGHVSGGRWRAR
jgi:hypothetical protein